MSDGTDSPKPKVPTITDEVREFVQKQQEESLKDANKAPNASPWRLAQVAGIKKILKAYELARELLIEEYVENNSKVDTLIDDKNRIEAEAIQAADRLIDDRMK